MITAPATSNLYALSLHDALQIFASNVLRTQALGHPAGAPGSPNVLLSDVRARRPGGGARSEEHTSELQSHSDLVCRALLEKKNYPRLVNRGWRSHSATMEHINDG